MASVLLFPAIAQAEKPISLVVGGVEVQTDVAPVLEGGRTLVPLRALTEALGFAVHFDDLTQTATLTKGDRSIQLTVGKQEALVNGSPVQLDIAPVTRGGRMLVPVRFVAETIDLDVAWDEASQSVRVTPKGEAVQSGGGVDPAALALLEKLSNVGTYKTHGTVELTVGSALRSATMTMDVEAYSNGQGEMLTYATTRGPGLEQKSGSAIYSGQVWLQDLTGAWVALPGSPAARIDPGSDPTGMARPSLEDLKGAEVTLVRQPYEGVDMQVVKVRVDLVEMTRRLGQDASQIASGFIVYTYWLGPDQTPHHMDILTEVLYADEYHTAISISGSVFYEPWDQPIPFPAEITGATSQ